MDLLLVQAQLELQQRLREASSSQPALRTAEQRPRQILGAELVVLHPGELGQAPSSPIVCQFLSQRLDHLIIVSENAAKLLELGVLLGR